MQPDKKKDALTDLVGVAGSSDSAQVDKPLKEGEAITPSGEIVTLGIDEDKELTNVARRLLKWAKVKQATKKGLDSQNK